MKKGFLVVMLIVIPLLVGAQDSTGILLKKTGTTESFFYDSSDFMLINTDGYYHFNPPIHDTIKGVLTFFTTPLPSVLMVDSVMIIREAVKSYSGGGYSEGLTSVITKYTPEWYWIKIYLLRNHQEIPLSNQFLFRGK